MVNLGTLVHIIDPDWRKAPRKDPTLCGASCSWQHKALTLAAAENTGSSNVCEDCRKLYLESED